MTLTQKEKDYKDILISICQERGLVDMANFVLGYSGNVEVAPKPKPVYNLTRLPEAVCDGCEG